MAQQEVYFRPPSEADSFLIRVMHGCSHNRCTFCNMFKGIPLEIVPEKEVLAGIVQDAANIGPERIQLVTSLYLEGGDPLCLSGNSLVRIMRFAFDHFPALQRVACYATARSILSQSPEELAVLAAAGLRRVYVGLESGSDSILESTGKGCTKADLIMAADKLATAGIENDVSIMLGIGGRALSEPHAVETAELLNRISPDCVRIRTFVPNRDTPLGNDYLEGRFILMEPHAVLEELRLLVERIESPMLLLSEHWSDFILFEARMPQEKDRLLSLIDEAILLPRSSFRPIGMSSERD